MIIGGCSCMLRASFVVDPAHAVLVHRSHPRSWPRGHRCRIDVVCVMFHAVRGVHRNRAVVARQAASPIPPPRRPSSWRRWPCRCSTPIIASTSFPPSSPAPVPEFGLQGFSRINVSDRRIVLVCDQIPGSSRSAIVCASVNAFCRVFCRLGCVCRLFQRSAHRLRSGRREPRDFRIGIVLHVLCAWSTNCW